MESFEGASALGPLVNESEEDSDVHICGPCKEEFTKIEPFVDHKAKSGCRVRRMSKIKANIASDAQVETTDPCAFNKLFKKNAPHLLENIFFSLDCASFKNCMEVNNIWLELLSSELYQRKFTEMLLEKIQNEKKLWLASQDGKAEEVRRLLSSGLLDVNCVPEKHMNYAKWPHKTKTPLCVAASRGCKEVVKVLLTKGADTEKADKHAYTPLLCAVSKGHKDVVELLLEGGADPNKPTDLGYTPLHWAAMRRRDVVELLLDRGADPNKANTSGCRWTALHYATEYGRIDIIQLLLNRGA